MHFRSKPSLTENELQSGLRLVVNDGLAAEVMTCFTSGTFLVAIAIYLGASNFQMGLLATLPVFSNVFQLLTLSLLQKYSSRKAITVIFSLLARVPLLGIAALPLLVSKDNCLGALLVLLSFHYFFGAVAGASWNAWMKDLVPAKILGSYFSHRTRLTQILNVTLSICLAIAFDHIKTSFPGNEIAVYVSMFLLGGVAGLAGIFALYKTPEPAVSAVPKGVFLSLKKPFRSKNFRKLLIFSSSWSFALNLVTPFLSVYMMRTLHLNLATIISVNVVGQLAGIVGIKQLGKYADQYSNKTIIRCLAPVYLAIMAGWSFVPVNGNHYGLLAIICALQASTGIVNAGICLALNNIGIKLSPAADSASYLAAKNICTAFFAAMGPLLGGLLADFFMQRSCMLGFEWTVNHQSVYINILHLHQWGFLFVIGPLAALCSLYFLKNVQEDGEIDKQLLVTHVRKKLRMRWIKLHRTPVALYTGKKRGVYSFKTRVTDVLLYRLPQKRA